MNPYTAMASLILASNLLIEQYVIDYKGLEEEHGN